MTDVRATLTAFFRDTLKIDVTDQEDDLIESGRLDSLALVELLFFLEQRFGVRVDVGQLDLDSLRSLDAIVRLTSPRDAGPSPGSSST